MRLTCPECDAQYEVDASLIPPEGRSVECARCGHGWHQPGLQPEPILLGDPDLAPEVDAPAPPPVAGPRPSAAALDILREEAQRELAQRAAARRSADDGARAVEAVWQGDAARLDNDPDSAAPDRPAEPDPDAPDPDTPELIVAELVEDDELPSLPAPMSAPSAEPRTEPVTEPVTAPVSPEPRPTAQGPLPDPHALAASLHWSPPARAQAAAPRPVPRAARAGYDAGFSLALALAVLLGGAYLAAPSLADSGRIGAGLSDYRRGADRARLWLFDHATRVVDGVVRR